MSDKDDNILDALSDLAGAVGSGFERVHREAAEFRGDVDRQFKEVHEELDTVHGQLDTMQGQLDRIEAIILKDHQARLDALERKVGLTAPKG